MAEMATSDSLFDDYKTLYIVSETLLSIFIELSACSFIEKIREFSFVIWPLFEAILVSENELLTLSSLRV